MHPTLVHRHHINMTPRSHPPRLIMILKEWNCPKQKFVLQENQRYPGHIPNFGLANMVYAGFNNSG